jgi:hypothetical protein
MVRRRGDRDGGGRACVLRRGPRWVGNGRMTEVDGPEEHDLRLEIGGRASSSRGRWLQRLSCHVDWTWTKARGS